MTRDRWKIPRHLRRGRPRFRYVMWQQQLQLQPRGKIDFAARLQVSLALHHATRARRLQWEAPKARATSILPALAWHFYSSRRRALRVCAVVPVLAALRPVLRAGGVSELELLRKPSEGCV